MSAIVPCKCCEKDVSPSARTCPHCGQTLRAGPIWTAIRWLAGASLAILLIVAFVKFVEIERERSIRFNRNGSDFNLGRPLSRKIGDTFRTAKFELQITDASERDAVGKAPLISRVAGDALFVVVSWSYKNVTSKPLSAFDKPTIALMSPDGTQYRPDVDATAANAANFELYDKITSDLNPGVRIRTAEVFEVGKELFDRSSWSIVISADEDGAVAFR